MQQFERRLQHPSDTCCLDTGHRDSTFLYSTVHYCWEELDGGVVRGEQERRGGERESNESRGVEREEGLGKKGGGEGRGRGVELWSDMRLEASVTKGMIH